ncbi:hypothetical protein H7F36_04365 [Variovorax sp. PAMC28562]|jgi:hypothetical protein|uniref:hypothetical protein n=1 Tax=Variovorax sp. PAMC28562 TaxID=2762323 RepID=UPI00164D6A80|nr:hypothetical protein [Variovorax sp. PAMC28562]QNK74477.1 hypothetical protein H7F36_04365 [Variovorax sp. PAMC28562]
MKKFKWVLLVICLLLVGWNVNAYKLGIEGRASIKKWTYEESPDGQYTLAYGDGPGYWVWVRLRKKGGDEVLADRWFESKEPYKSAWLGDRVYYSHYDADGPIYLPPVWLEKWLARLP